MKEVSVHRMEMFVSDNDVGKVHRLVGRYAVGPIKLMPVVNAEVSKKNGVIRAKSSGNAADMFLAHLKKEKQHRFTTKDVKVFLTKQGLSASSFNYITRKLEKAHAIKKAGKGEFEISSS